MTLSLLLYNFSTSINVSLLEFICLYLLDRTLSSNLFALTFCIGYFLHLLMKLCHYKYLKQAVMNLKSVKVKNSIRFHTNKLLGSIVFFSSLISSNNFFASGLNLLKKLIIFGNFESVLMFLITSNCFFLDPQLHSIFFSNFKGLFFSVLLLNPHLKVYSMENNQI